MSSRGWQSIRFFTVLVYLFTFVPIVIVVLLSFNPARFGTFPMHGFSLHWFVELAHDEAIVNAFKTSVLLGLATSILSTTVGVMASLALVRYRFFGQEMIRTLLITPILVPEVVLGVALLLFMRFVHVERNFGLLLMGHILITLPFVVLVVQARLVGISRTCEEAAQSLGANRFQTFFEVTLPQLLPAVFAGMLFAFTISFDDITATLFWLPPGVETVPAQIYAMLRNSITPEINALGTVMIVITVGLPLTAGWIARRLMRGPSAKPAREPKSVEPTAANA
jgi:spermidine/putrescine transport system permease protein